MSELSHAMRTRDYSRAYSTGAEQPGLLSCRNTDTAHRIVIDTATALQRKVRRQINTDKGVPSSLVLP
jgi:hypothetical protein